MILAGDVGGTHARLALFAGVEPEPRELEIYKSAKFESFEEILREFVSAHPIELSAATIGVAGPVIDGRTEAINLAWPVDARRAARELGADPGSVWVINDLEANAWGLEALGPDDLAKLNDPEPEPMGTVALISAGTGLGEAFLTYGAEGPAAHASEGGHADFAPQTELQEELRRWLGGSDDHVSYEDVCSGRGLVNIYGFLRERADEPEPDWLVSARDAGDAGKAITEAGLSRRDAVAGEALDLMVSIYGAQAGNLALTVLATGGVYLGGGIPPRIAERLREPGFIRAFAAKGRMSRLMDRMPVFLILNDRAAILGAARHAAAASRSGR